MGTHPAVQPKAKIAAVSQTRFLLVYSGEVTLTGRSKFKTLALPLLPKVPLENADTSRLW